MGFKTDRLFKLQKRIVRIITCSKYNDHIEQLFKNAQHAKNWRHLENKSIEIII